MHFRHPLGSRRIVISTMLAVSTVVTQAALADTAAAATATATLAVDKPCYVDTFVPGGGLAGPPMVITGSGYVPNDKVMIASSDGTVAVQVTADSAGNITTVTQAPRPGFTRPQAKLQTLTATDNTVAGTTIIGTTTVRDTLLDVSTVPASAASGRKVTWHFSGYVPGRYIYGHYLRHHKQVARARFGRATGPCGLLSVRARFFPGHQRFRYYGLQLDDAFRYSSHSTPRIVTTIRPY